MRDGAGVNSDLAPVAQDWKRIEELLDAALTLDSAAREAWLAGLADADRAHAGTLRRLLAVSDTDTGPFMRHPVGLATLDAVAEDMDGDAPGDLVGGYRLESRLGSGGMSTVWLARDTERVLNRRVALKLPKLGWQPGVAERMRQEWAILASLEHPGIARLYDAGTGEDGRPFIAMEHIDGTPIDKHVAAGTQTLAGVLHLVLQVADALAFAHARLVVHRDIKPSNILVSRTGQVKLLDFGVARLLDKGIAPRSDLTLSLGRLMTPGYASPEQVAGQAVTVASDVYSLGVVLYELLAGARPYRLRRQTPAALEEAILEADIPLVSKRALATIPWRRALRGDIDSILAKAMHRDPTARYGSIAEFSDDLRRYLKGLPVRARPEHWLYSARKFAWRHRLGVATLALFAVVLVAGVSAVAWQATQAREQARLAALERDRALQELHYAQAAEEYIRFVLAESLAQGRPLADVLKVGERTLDDQLGRDPALRGRLQLALAQLYSELEDQDRRESMIISARASAMRSNDEALQDATQCVAAGELFTKGMHTQALELLDKTIDRAALREKDGGFALQACLTERSGAYRILGRPAQALVDARQALAMLDASSPGNYSKVVGLRSQIGDAITLGGDFAGAVAEHRQLVEQYFGSGRGRTSLGLYITNHYILSLARAGQVAEAYREYRRILGLLGVESNGNLAVLIHNHARLLVAMERFDEADTEVRQMLRIDGPSRSRGLGLFSGLFPAMIACGKQQWDVCDKRISASEARVSDPHVARHSIHATHLWLRAWALSGTGRGDAALATVDQAIQRYKGASDSNPYLVRARILRAELLDRAGRDAEAREEGDRAVADAEWFSTGFPHSEWRGRALLAKGRILHRQGEHAQAQLLVAQARVQLDAALGADSPIARAAARPLS
jgi:eukaryotic-like serine/threonine-protein kinase